MVKTPGSGDAYQWQREKRVALIDSDRRVRHPSIARVADRSLLVMYTRQNAEQEAAGVGEFVVTRSTDEGDGWSEGTVVFEASEGEPRASATMTALADGRVLAPFTELADQQQRSTVRLLESGDQGQTWAVRSVQVDLPLVWWAPSGRIVQASDGALVMPVYGAASESDLKATIHSCGLLRSGDGGTTWGDFSWIVRGPSPVYGAAADRQFAFEGPSVAPLPDGRWLAMVTARRLNKEATGPTVSDEGPGAPHLVCRLWSADEGRQWTRPDQLWPGAWPTVIAMGDHTLGAWTTWAAWGNMTLAASRDGFESLFQSSVLMTLGWLQGRANDPHEAPLPPTVPYLADGWAYEHYGFSAGLALDDDNLVVVLDRPQRGEGQIEGLANQSIPYEHERIEAVFYRRARLPGPSASPPATPPRRPQGRWVLTERIVVPDLGANMAQAPDGTIIAIVADQLKRSRDGGRSWREIEQARLPGNGALGILNSGRWLVAAVKVNKEWQNGRHTEMGLVGGYPTFKIEGEAYDCHIVVWRSDDEGRTWAAGEPFKGPFRWALPTVSHFIEAPDGTIALPIFGCVTEEEMSSYSSSNGVIRSRDGGETWGDFSFAFRTQPPGPGDHQPEPRYSEMDIAQLPNGHWVAYSRNERLTMGPAGWGATAVAVSEDYGRTWRRTGGSLAGVSQQKGVVLPDGGIALTYRCHSWQQPGVAITYDEGRSFDYMLTGPYETVNAFMHGQHEFVVFSATSHRSDSMAGVYRWAPDSAG